MPYQTPVSSQPIDLAKRTEAQVYVLFAAAMALTTIGIYFGIQFAPMLLSSGVFMALLIAELALIITSRWWVNSSPLNYLLFAAFPLFSGFTITPFILSVLTEYANGASILVNAFGATVFMSAAAAVFARTTSWNLGAFAKALIIGLIGLIILGVLQIFVPAFRTTTFELAISGAGILIFAGFLAFDLQRISRMGRMGANPFLLALSLYLDIFNLFLYVLRFMVALSGNRR